MKKVLFLKTNDVRDVPDEYAARLYEQGQAVFQKEEPVAKPEEKKEEKPKAKKG